jgi:transaldolase
MKKTSIQTLGDFGQSIWLDNINRSMLKNGKLKDMITLGLRGMTSNPSIFEKAIINSNIYDNDIDKLINEGKSVFDIYDELTIKDIQDAASIFKEVYDNTNMLDGYVSLEINPDLAFNAKETIEEGKRLHRKVNRPNLMLKVPATEEGFEAIEELTSLGMNVNMTLIFSPEQYERTANAYIKGIKRLIESGKDPKNVHSVASVFVSRTDALVDSMIDNLMSEGKDLNGMKGKIASSVCEIIYKKYLEIFSGDIWESLENKGANKQRVLWASTSTKNPSYSDIKYVTELIAKDTVNTLPENTLKAFLDHGEVKEALGSDDSNAQKIMHELAKNEIDIKEVLNKLLKDGLLAFQKSFNSLLKSIEAKKAFAMKNN